MPGIGDELHVVDADLGEFLGDEGARIGLLLGGRFGRERGAAKDGGEEPAERKQSFFMTAFRLDAMRPLLRSTPQRTNGSEV